MNSRVRKQRYRVSQGTKNGQATKAERGNLVERRSQLYDELVTVEAEVTVSLLSSSPEKSCLASGEL
jgi:hypothetical protein